MELEEAWSKLSEHRKQVVRLTTKASWDFPGNGMLCHIVCDDFNFCDQSIDFCLAMLDNPEDNKEYTQELLVQQRAYLLALKEIPEQERYAEEDSEEDLAMDRCLYAGYTDRPEDSVD